MCGLGAARTVAMCGILQRMALIVITLQDGDDGEVDLRVEAEPPLPMQDPEAPTPAQTLALRMIAASIAASESVEMVAES